MNLTTAWVQLYKLLSSSHTRGFNVVFSSTRVSWIRARQARSKFSVLSSGLRVRSIIMAGAAISRTFLTPFNNPRGFRSLIITCCGNTAEAWYYNLGKTGFFIRALIANLWCANFNLLPAKYPKFNNNQMELGFGTEFQFAECMCAWLEAKSIHMILGLWDLNGDKEAIVIALPISQ